MRGQLVKDAVVSCYKCGIRIQTDSEAAGDGTVTCSGRTCGVLVCVDPATLKYVRLCASCANKRLGARAPVDGELSAQAPSRCK